jgi:hypothetical protein
VSLVADEYIPTTEQIRQGYAGNAPDYTRQSRLAAFDHWLQEHDRRVLVEYESRRLPGPMRIENIDGVRASVWLNEHDQRIKAAVREKVVRELQHAAASVPREESYPDYTLAGGLAHAARIVRG